MPKILIAGASGFVGTHLCKSLKLSGYKVVALERHTKQLEHVDRIAPWDGLTVDAWTEELETSDVLVNLAGKNIACQWTPENRRALRDSRVGVTELLGEACRLVAAPPRVWVNMSGINAYPANREDPIDESGPRGSGFLADLVHDWEQALFSVELPTTRRFALRAAPVLGKGGGAFDIYVKLVKGFIGGAAGTGKQWMSWIHVSDLVRLITWLTERTTGSEGVYNACSPEPLRNKDFMAGLRSAYRRPWAPPAPAFAVRLLGMLGGPDPSLALDGYRIVPQRALDEGFEFRFPTLREALKDLASS